MGSVMIDCEQSEMLIELFLEKRKTATKYVAK
jgi:hypothetical protein